jgi:hypothetical protein
MVLLHITSFATPEPFELPFNVDVFVAEDEAKRCNTDETKFIQQR